jgi:hypothetical protein
MCKTKYNTTQRAAAIESIANRISEFGARVWKRRPGKGTVWAIEGRAAIQAAIDVVWQADVISLDDKKALHREMAIAEKGEAMHLMQCDGCQGAMPSDMLTEVGNADDGQFAFCACCLSDNR